MPKRTKEIENVIENDFVSYDEKNSKAKVRAKSASKKSRLRKIKAPVNFDQQFLQKLVEKNKLREQRHSIENVKKQEKNKTNKIDTKKQKIQENSDIEKIYDIDLDHIDEKENTIKEKKQSFFSKLFNKNEIAQDAVAESIKEEKVEKRQKSEDEPIEKKKTKKKDIKLEDVLNEENIKPKRERKSKIEIDTDEEKIKNPKKKKKNIQEFTEDSTPEIKVAKGITSIEDIYDIEIEDNVVNEELINGKISVNNIKIEDELDNPYDVKISEKNDSKAKRDNKKSKMQIFDKDKYLEKIRNKIIKETKDAAKTEKGQVKIKSDDKNSLFDIVLPSNEFDIVIDKSMYRIYQGNSSSYIIADKPILKIMFKKLYVYIEKVEDTYFVVSNEDIKFSEQIKDISKKKDVIGFYTNNLKEIILENDIMEIECKNSDELLLENNDTLIISEEDNKVYLPYTADDLRGALKVYNDLSVEEIIDKVYVCPLKNYKNSFKARFREGFNLMYNKEKKPFKDAFFLGVELMFELNLHPAVISACKSLEELDIYLDCLDDNELDKFSCFKIIYKALPVISKTNKDSKNVGLEA